MLKKLIWGAAIGGAIYFMNSCVPTPQEQAKEGLDRYVQVAQQQNVVPSVDQATEILYDLQISNAVTDATVPGFANINSFKGLSIEEMTEGAFTAVITENNILPCRQYETNIICGDKDAIIDAAKGMLQDKVMETYNGTASKFDRFLIRLRKAKEAFDQYKGE